MVNRKTKCKYTIEKGDTTHIGTYMGENFINFSIVLEKKVNCILRMYELDGKEPIFEHVFVDKEGFGNIYSIKVCNITKEAYEYEYIIDDKAYADPYARGLTNRKEWGVIKEEASRSIVRRDNYDWEDDSYLLHDYSNTIIYNTHVRGFTKHTSSKVKKKGTFIGMLEKADYLKELEVTAIELMPAYEFEEIMPIKGRAFAFAKPTELGSNYLNYWGYDKAISYFAPKASYAYSKNPVSEFKDMVKGFHKKDIEVFMEFYFSKDTKYRTIRDCICFWVREFHIDGAHISCDEALLNALASEPELASTKLMGNYFNTECIYESDYKPPFKNLAEYNDGFLHDMRRFLKGDEEQLDSVIYRNKKNDEKYAVVNFIAAHNGFNLNDLVSYETKHNEANGENNRDGNNYNYSWNCGVEGPTRRKAVLELRERQVRNALLMLFLSQGVPLIWGGDEFLNTQKGNNNPYCQDNEISWINWNALNKNKQIFEFFKELIKFRKEHPILHSGKELRQMDYLSCGYPDVSYHGKKAWYAELENYNRQIGIMYCGKYEKTAKGKEDKFIFVAYNMHWLKYEFALPNLPKKDKWVKVIDSNIGFIEEKEVNKTMVVGPRSIVVLVSK